MSENIVRKITITLGEKDVDLSIEDARNLLTALTALFGVPQTIIYPQLPYIPWPWYEPIWRVTWDAGSTGTPPAGPGTIVYCSNDSSAKIEVGPC